MPCRCKHVLHRLIRQGMPQVGECTDDPVISQPGFSRAIRTTKASTSQQSHPSIVSHADRLSYCVADGLKSLGNTRLSLAPRVGLEPTTLRLTAECSTIELPRTKLAGRLHFTPARSSRSLPRQIKRTATPRTQTSADVAVRAVSSANCLPRVRQIVHAQNRSLSANWITRGLTLVFTICPKFGADTLGRAG